MIMFSLFQNKFRISALSVVGLMFASSSFASGDWSATIVAEKCRVSVDGKYDKKSGKITGKTKIFTVPAGQCEKIGKVVATTQKAKGGKVAPISMKFKDKKIIKCEQVALKGMNECGANAHGCHGESTHHFQKKEWVTLPIDLCTKIQKARRIKGAPLGMKIPAK